MKRYMKYSVVLCALILPGMVMAADPTWVNWAGDQDWANGGNWNTAPNAPIAADNVHFYVGGLPTAVVSTAGQAGNTLAMDGVSSLSIATGGTLTLGGTSLIGNDGTTGNNISVDGGTFNSQAIALGINGGGSLTVNSGTHNQAGAWLITGYGATGTGNVTVNNGGILNGTLSIVGLDGAGTMTVNDGGTVNLSSQLQVAVQSAGSTGHVVMNGGTLSATAMNLGTAGTATIDLNAGQLTTGGYYIAPSTVFNIGAGELIFTGALAADIDWMIDNGGATWNFAGVNGNVRSVTEDGLGNVTVTAIPEPATLVWCPVNNID